MKACDHIRSILLTDYIDGELDSKAKKDIETHLAACPECARLIAGVKEEISVISDKSLRGELPPHLWNSILKRIEDEKRPLNKITDIIKGIAEKFTLPRLVPALVGIVLLVLSASFFLYTQRISHGYGDESFKYTSELLTGEGASAAMENEGLGTPIEEYFL